jgi:soluble lytic murein transglycosylase-like protein
MTISDPTAAVRARIAQIENRFGASGGGVRATGSDATAFASALSAAQSGLTTQGVVTGAEVAAQSLKYLGVPYKWGGTDPATGLDCSALVQRAYKDLGVDLPRVAADQARAGTPVANLAQAKPGDLVAFGEPVDHIGIYLGNNKMIVAPQTGDVVKIQDVPSTITAIRRIVDGATPAGGSAGAGAYAELFQSAAAKHGLPASVLQAVAKHESGFNPRAVSPAGAQGLMQLMPGTAKGLGVNPFDPAQAVDGAARILSGNLQKFGSLDKALAAYNAGPGAVQKYGGVPPYAETQGYVRRILDDLRKEGV